jgi:hypothetical protein
MGLNMRKIPALYSRDATGALQLGVYNPLALWVMLGEGVATRKWDGTAVLVSDGVVHARYDAKHGKAPPPGFVPAQDPDPITGHWPGWVRADRPQDKWIRDAVANNPGHPEDGTYEACGPRIGGNPEGLDRHTLIRHGTWHMLDAPRTHLELVKYLSGRGIEGLVWWREPGVDACDKVKITAEALGVHRGHVN